MAGTPPRVRPRRAPPAAVIRKEGKFAKWKNVKTIGTVIESNIKLDELKKNKEMAHDDKVGGLKAMEGRLRERSRKAVRSGDIAEARKLWKSAVYVRHKRRKMAAAKK